jgi:hypothetical protein
MDPVDDREGRARQLVMDLYTGRIDDNGIPLFEHMREVAERCPPAARVVGWLHDVAEDGLMELGELCSEMSLSGAECEALGMLTRSSDGSYEEYIEGLASRDSPAGAIARAVKRADLRANLNRPVNPRRAHLRTRYEAALIRLGSRSDP